MLPLTIAEIAAACGGRADAVDANAVVRGIAIDSRAARSGDLFVALPGERTDGHRFARDAIAAGAVAVLARAETSVGDAPAVRVADPAAGLFRVAEIVRGRSDARVIAVTGSSGKTCTKQMTAAACRAAFRTVASTASYNNELGVPLTICALETDTEILVAEVGSRGPGHIAALMPLLRPDVSVVTNVGAAHYAMFGSLDATAAAKAEIVSALSPQGVAVLNVDDVRVEAMRDRTKARVVSFGWSPAADVRAEHVDLDDRARPRFKVVTPDGAAAVSLRIPGEHMVYNALAAIAAAGVVGVPLEEAAHGVADVDAPAWRMEVSETAGGVTVVNDAYNANPASAAAALKTLVALGRGRRTWAVLGEMAELGDIAAREQDRLGRLSVRLGVSRLVAVGDVARPACEAARLEGMAPDEAACVKNVDEAIALLLEAARPGDVVLVKASRVAGLERVAEALIAGARGASSGGSSGGSSGAAR